MLHTSFYQRSFLELDPDIIGLAANSFERHLRSLLPRIVSLEDFAGFYHDDLGTPSCCPIRLTGMLLLQFRYDLSDPQVVDRCNRDLGFKCALGMTADERSYSVSSLRRHRRKLRKRLGEDFIHRRVLDIAVEGGLVDDSALQAVDSTNTSCRGAVFDSYNLVAAAIRQVTRKVASCLGLRPGTLAKQWRVGRYLQRNFKGAVSIDWNDKHQRALLVTQEVSDAERIAARIRDLQFELPSDIAESVDLMLRAAHQDVQRLDDGSYTIAQAVAPGRIISITDPQARHGRKSESKVINGFKTNVKGTIESQFVTGIVITDASTHDSEATGLLIDQTTISGVRPNEIVGDCAYGTGPNRRRCRERGIELHAKTPTRSTPGAFGKHLFDIDLDSMTVTCPAGNTTSKYTLVKDPDAPDASVPNFNFCRTVCQPCPRRMNCNSQTKKGGGRRVRLSHYEREMRQARAYNATPRGKETLRARSAVERLISHLVRMGMRHARFFGMHMVQFQAFMTAAAYNLQRYVTLCCQRR